MTNLSRQLWQRLNKLALLLLLATTGLLSACYHDINASDLSTSPKHLHYYYQECQNSQAEQVGKFTCSEINRIRDQFVERVQAMMDDPREFGERILEIQQNLYKKRAEYRELNQQLASAQEPSQQSKLQAKLEKSQQDYQRFELQYQQHIAVITYYSNY